jgi:hypothetical protein
LPLHQWHIGLLLATGYLNGAMPGHLIKGNVRKKKTVSEISDSEKGVTVTKVKDIITVTIKILDKDGNVFELI